MRIALINGSPKIKDSTSGILLEDIKSYLYHQAEVIDIHMYKPILSKSDLEQLRDVDIFVFSCPLYVDGIPGHLLSCLSQLEEVFKTNHTIKVYGIVNCGFYEGIQAKLALQILQNWCLKTGLIWGGGIGIGGGGALAQVPTVKNGHGPKAPVDKALQVMSVHILQSEIQENDYISIAFSRFLYQLAAQFGWRQLIKANGGKSKNLGKQWR